MKHIMKERFKKTFRRKEFCICLIFIFLLVLAFFYTDYGTFRWPLPFLAVGVLVYTIGKSCFERITSEKNKNRYLMGLGIVVFLIFAACEVVLYLIQMDFQFLYYILDYVINDYDIQRFTQIIANAGILVVDVWFLILLVQRVFLKREKLDFNVKNGVFVVLRYLVGGYLLVPPFTLVRYIHLIDLNLSDYGLLCFIFLPCTVYCLAYIAICKWMFPDSKELRLCLTVIIVPLLIVLEIVLGYLAIEDFMILATNGTPLGMLHLYVLQDLLFPVLSGVGIMFAIYSPKRPTIRVMLATYMTMILLTTFSMPQYWIVKEMVRDGDFYKELSQAQKYRVITSCADTAPTILGLLEEDEWAQITIEPFYQNDSRMHIVNSWISQQYRDEPERWYEYNFSQYRVKKMLEEKLGETKRGHH